MEGKILMHSDVLILLSTLLFLIVNKFLIYIAERHIIRYFLIFKKT